MRCLFVFSNAPLSENYSGGAARHLNSFQALHSLGIKIHVCRLLAEDKLNQVYTFEQSEGHHTNLQSQSISWQDTIYQRHKEKVTGGFVTRKLKILSHALTRPNEYFFPDTTRLKKQFQKILNETQPDFIWAEWILVGVLAHSVIDSEFPWIYAHTDWLYKIYSIRNSAANRRANLGFLLLNALRRGLEERVVRSCTTVVTGSATESQEINQIGQSNTFIIPTTYQYVSIDLSQPTPEPVRLIHLGALRTTANYVGLMSYFQKAHQVVMQKLSEIGYSAEFWIIGDTGGVKPDLEKLLIANNVVLRGYVANLKDVLRPFDIAIVSHTQDTGTRTKLPLFFNYAQVVVATENAVKGTTEILSKDCCVVLKKIEDFPEVLVNLATNAERRKALGTAAKGFFDQHFTLDSQMHNFQSAVETVAKI